MGIQGSIWKKPSPRSAPKFIRNTFFRRIHLDLQGAFNSLLDIGRQDTSFIKYNEYAMGTHVSFIFRGYDGYNPYLGGVKPSFFHGLLGSKGVSPLSTHRIDELLLTQPTAVNGFSQGPLLPPASLAPLPAVLCWTKGIS